MNSADPTLHHQLQLTQAWFALDLHEPDIFQGQWNRQLFPYSTDLIDHASLEQVIRKCLSFVHEQRQRIVGAGINGQLIGGRLLIFIPGDSLNDGLAHSHSNGFYHGTNCPPCDTWVGFKDATKLLCFIPDFLLAQADRGQEVNAERCLYWEDQE